MSAPHQLAPASDTGWLAIYTRPNQEEIAVSNIARQGYDAYCPTIERRRSHARRVELVRRPLFPSYVFARLDANKPQWRRLLSTRGVATVVRFNDRPGFLPHELITQLRSCEQHNRLAEAVAPKFEPGTEVRIVDGPFRDFVARVLSANEKDRVWLLLDIMGQAVRVQYEAWSLER